MDKLMVQGESNRAMGSAAETLPVAGFWFYFSYYATPALLVERELPMK
jgi:hypothetical protein